MHTAHPHLIESYLILQQVQLQFKGLNISIKGRLRGKMGRSKHFGVHYGILSRTTLSIPTQYASTTIFSPLGAIGLKLTFR